MTTHLPPGFRSTILANFQCGENCAKFTVYRISQFCEMWGFSYKSDLGPSSHPWFFENLFFKFVKSVRPSFKRFSEKSANSYLSLLTFHKTEATQCVFSKNVVFEPFCEKCAPKMFKFREKCALLWIIWQLKKSLFVKIGHVLKNFWS